MNLTPFLTGYHCGIPLNFFDISRQYNLILYKLGDIWLLKSKRIDILLDVPYSAKDSSMFFDFPEIFLTSETMFSYRSLTKLRKVMFSVVFVYWQGGGVPKCPLPMMHWTSLYRPPVQGPGSYPASDIWWPRLETCSNLFTSGSHHTAPPPKYCRHLVASYWSTYGVWAGGIHHTGMASCSLKFYIDHINLSKIVWEHFSLIGWRPHYN